MKKFILSVFALLAFSAALFATDDKKPSTPLGFKEAEIIGTVKEIVVVNADRNLQYWTVKVDGKDAPYHLFTDEKGKVGERIVIYVMVRVGGQVSWIKVRPL